MRASVISEKAQWHDDDYRRDDAAWVELQQLRADKAPPPPQILIAGKRSVKVAESVGKKMEVLSPPPLLMTSPYLLCVTVVRARTHPFTVVRPRAFSP
jgi:hypothetical protein